MPAQKQSGAISTVKSNIPRSGASDEQTLWDCIRNHFKTVDDVVTLVDINGAARLDAKGKPIQRKLGPGEDARKVACWLTKEHIPNRRGDFNRKIIYPNVGKF